MALREISRLVVSSDALEDCSLEEANVPAIRDGNLVREDAGFAIAETSVDHLELRARRFVVGLRNIDEGQAGWFDERHVDVPIDYATEFGLDPDVLTGCSTGPTVRFTLKFDHDECTATVLVRIGLLGSRVSEAERDAWERAILGAWSNLYKLVRTSGSSPCAEYVILIAIEWIQDPVVAVDQTVTVIGGCERPNMLTWYKDLPDILMAHEFGHMLGNIDEYDGADDGCPDRPVRRGIMNNQHRWRQADPRHYYLIRRYAESSLCSSFDVQPLVLEWHVTGGNYLGTWSKFKESWCKFFDDFELFGWVGGIGG